GNTAAWMVVSEDLTEAMIAYYRVLQKPEAAYDRILLRGIDKDALYCIQEMNLSGESDLNTGYYYGSELLNIGIVISDYSSGRKEIAADIQGDYLSRVYYMKKV
ncbi:MAG: GH36 C-terminal domain-containing protein, partial [Mobilitalea sp.]